MEAGSWMSQVPNLHLAMQLVNPSITLNTDIQEEDQAYRIDIENQNQEDVQKRRLARKRDNVSTGANTVSITLYRLPHQLRDSS